MEALNKILEHYPEHGYDKVDGLDDAIIGVSINGKLVYSVQKIVDIGKFGVFFIITSFFGFSLPLERF